MNINLTDNPSLIQLETVRYGETLKKLQEYKHQFLFDIDGVTVYLDIDGHDEIITLTPSGKNAN